MPMDAMPEGLRILLVEDSPDVGLLLREKLIRAGFEVRLETDGHRGLAAARQIQPDLVILDRGLPGLSGLEVCRRLRETSDVPILMLTADGDLSSRIEGLEVGASDYLPKPFDMGELLARVRAQLRGRRPRERTRFAVGDLSLDLESREVRRGDEALVLTTREFELLRRLIENAGLVVKRERLMELVWGYDFDGPDNVLDVFVRSLRAKIERPGAPKLLHTSRGVGYALRLEATGPLAPLP